MHSSLNPGNALVFSAKTIREIATTNILRHKLVLIYFCYIFFRKAVFKASLGYIHFNLCIALLLGLITLVAGLEASSNIRVRNHS